MKEMNITTKAVPASRIHISSRPPSTPQYLSFKAQPPRPPCWQDFIGKNLKSDNRANSKVNISLSTSTDADKKHQSPSTHRSKYKKSSNSVKSKGISSGGVAASHVKLKRTRSEPCIAEKEIPADAIQTRLTTEQLSRQSFDETKRYLEDTYQKCSQWLAQISPALSIPLEDTDFEVGSGDIITCEDETERKGIDYHAKRHSLALDKIPE